VDPAAKYEINTTSGVAAVRGSQMLVQVVNDGTTSVYNLEGAISFSAQGSTVAIPVGSGSTAKPGQTPSRQCQGCPRSRNFRARRQLPRRRLAADRSVAEYRRQVLRGLPGRQLDGGL